MRSKKQLLSVRLRWMNQAYVSSCLRGEEGVKQLGLTVWHLPLSACKFKQVSVTLADNRKLLCSEGISCSCQLASFDVHWDAPDDLFHQGPEWSVCGNVEKQKINGCISCFFFFVNASQRNQGLFPESLAGILNKSTKASPVAQGSMNLCVLVWLFMSHL